MKIQNCMNRNVQSISVSDTVKQAAEMMRDHFIESLIVINQGSPIGIVTERDICHKVVALSKNPEHTPVKEIMTKSLITARSDDTIQEVSRRMGLAKIKQVPIVDNNNALIGKITSTDLVRVIANMQKDLSSMHDL